MRGAIRTFFRLTLCVLTLAMTARAQVPPPPAASQTEVNAGTVKNKYVSPSTLAGYTGVNRWKLPAVGFGDVLKNVLNVSQNVVVEGDSYSSPRQERFTMPAAWLTNLMAYVGYAGEYGGGLDFTNNFSTAPWSRLETSSNALSPYSAVTLYASDGSNDAFRAFSFYSALYTTNEGVATRLQVDKISLAWRCYPNGGNAHVRVNVQGVDSNFVVNGFSSVVGGELRYTNWYTATWGVTGPTNCQMYLGMMSGTNTFIAPGFTKTNGGVTATFLSQGGQTLSGNIGIGTNFENQLSAYLNPDILSVHEYDGLEVTNSLSFLTNELFAFLPNLAGHAQTFLCSTPAADFYPVTNYEATASVAYQLYCAAHSNAWFVDLLSRFPSYTDNTNRGLMSGGDVHPTFKGVMARAKAFCEITWLPRMPDIAWGGLATSDGSRYLFTTNITFDARALIITEDKNNGSSIVATGGAPPLTLGDGTGDEVAIGNQHIVQLRSAGGTGFNTISGGFGSFTLTTAGLNDFTVGPDGVKSYHSIILCSTNLPTASVIGVNGSALTSSNGTLWLSWSLNGSTKIDAKLGGN